MLSYEKIRESGLIDIAQNSKQYFLISENENIAPGTPRQFALDISVCFSVEKRPGAK
jgi:hypothetical protein